MVLYEKTTVTYLHFSVRFYGKLRYNIVKAVEGQPYIILNVILSFPVFHFLQRQSFCNSRHAEDSRL